MGFSLAPSQTTIVEPRERARAAASANGDLPLQRPQKGLSTTFLDGTTFTGDDRYLHWNRC